MIQQKLNILSKYQLHLILDFIPQILHKIEIYRVTQKYMTLFKNAVIFTPREAGR